MARSKRQKIWVAIQIKGGFITDVRAYSDRVPARRTELRWRQEVNPDYDETGLWCVTLDEHSRATARA